MLAFSLNANFVKGKVLRVNSHNYRVESRKQQEMLPCSPNAKLKGQYCEQCQRLGEIVVCRPWEPLKKGGA
jgi:hypothetical protein